MDLGGSVLIAGFKECSALTIETETLDYAEGGLNSYTHKLPVRTKYSNITLKRGFDQGHDLFEWYVQTINGNPNKKNISIILYDSQLREVRRWDLKNAYPVKWIGPDLKADSGAVAIETIEIAHEGLLPTSTSNGPPVSAPSVQLTNPDTDSDDS